MQLQEPRCFTRNCVHFAGVKNRIEGDDLSHVNYCTAFPDGIPGEIAYGDNLHLKPLKGQGNDIVYQKEEDEFKAYAYLTLMDDKRISIRARMEGTPGEADEGVIGDMEHIVEVGEEWAGIPYEKLCRIAERGDAIDMSKLEEI